MSYEFTNDYQKKKSVQLSFENAFNMNDVDAVEALLAEGNEFVPDINAQMISNYPILMALKDNNLPMLNVLFQAGADLDVANERGWHFSHELATKSAKLVKKILPHVSMAVNLPDGTTPLMVAIEKENWEVVETLLDSDNSLRVYSVNDEGNTAAHMLAKAKQIQLLEKMIFSADDSYEAFLPNAKRQTPFDFIENEDLRERIKEKVKAVQSEFNQSFLPDDTVVKSVVDEQPNIDVAVKAETNSDTASVEEKPKPKKMGLGGIKKNF